MNIYITESEHEKLYALREVEIVMGSKLYGTDTEKSDTDILVFVNYPVDWNADFVEIYPNYHQFQYKDKENKVDYIYTTFRQFMRNQISGDATINSDVIMFTDNFATNDEQKLALCRTYNVIKAYLGFAKRDLKSKSAKKMHHAHRSLYCAGMLLDNGLPTVKHIQQIYRDEFDGMNRESLIEYESALRKRLNAEFDANTIQKYYIPKVADSLFQKLLNSNNIKNFIY